MKQAVAYHGVARWPLHRLGDLVTDAQAGFASGERSDSGVAQLRMNNVTDRGTFDWSKLLRVPASRETVGAFSLERGDVLFNNTNSTALVGKSALFEGFSEEITFSNHFTRLRTAQALLLPEFLAYWLQLQWKRRVFENICNRWIGQAAVQRDKLLCLEIQLPPLDDQRRIVAEIREKFEHIEKARVAAAAQLEAAKALPAAYLREVFESPEAERWPMAKLAGLLAEPVRTGISKQGSPSSDKLCLTLSSVREGWLDFAQAKPADVTDAAAECCWVRPNAFYVVRGNGNKALVARGALAPHSVPRILFPDLLIQVITDPSRMLPRFLRLAWDSPRVRAEIESRARTSAGIFKINQANLGAVCIPCPPIDVQERLCTLLEAKMISARSLRDALSLTGASIEALTAAYLRSAL
jgi:type I restriction enzyme, S subunit